LSGKLSSGAFKSFVVKYAFEGGANPRSKNKCSRAA
jgi:hypothetical protein